MKISGNAVTLPSTPSEVQTNTNKTSAQAGLIEVGQMIEGKVTGESGKNVTLLSVEGVSIALILENSEPLSGKNIQVVITEVMEGQVKGKVLESNQRDVIDFESPTAVNERLDQLLAKIGVEQPSSRYREALSALIKYGLPVHQESLNGIKLEGQLLDKLNQLMDQIPENVLEQVKELPMKDAVKQLLQLSQSQNEVTTMQSLGQGESEHVGVQNSENMKSSSQIAVNKGLEKSVNATGNLGVNGSPDSTTELDTTSALDTASELEGANSLEFDAPSEEKLVKAFSKMVQEALQSGVQAEKSALLKTLDVQTTIQNLVLSEHLLGNNNKMNLSDLLTRLTTHVENTMIQLDALGNGSFDKMASLVKELESLLPTDVDAHQGLLEELDQEVKHLLSDQGVPTDIKKLLSEQSDLIQASKEGFDFLKQASQTLGFVQLKMNYDGEPAQFEMAYKRKKKEKGEGERIFISLDTHHIGTVQSLIDLKSNGVTIQFNVDHKAVKARFEESFQLLKEEIQSVLKDEGKAYAIVIRMYGEEMTVKSLFMNEHAMDQMSGFDLRV